MRMQRGQEDSLPAATESRTTVPERSNGRAGYSVLDDGSQNGSRGAFESNLDSLEISCDDVGSVAEKTMVGDSDAG